MTEKRTIDRVLKEQAAKGRAPCPLCGRLVGLDREGRVNVHGAFGESCKAGGKKP